MRVREALARGLPLETQGLVRAYLRVYTCTKEKYADIVLRKETST